MIKNPNDEQNPNTKNQILFGFPSIPGKITEISQK